MKKGYAIGYDLNDKFGQISFYDYEKDEPHTLDVAADNCQIPLALAFFNNRWVYGKEAKRLGIINAGFAFVNFYEKARHREKITVNGKTYDAVWLLAKFVKMSLEDFKDVDFLTFTVPTTDVDTFNMLKAIGLQLSIPKEKIAVHDYKESFCHYMYDQPKELWQYEAAMFYCDDEEMKAFMLRKLNTIKNDDEDFFITVDEVASATISELSAILPLFDENKAQDADDKFKSFIKGVFDKKVVSSVFLTGEGFEQEWYPKSLKVLCNGRRAFLGNNLYSKGACYYSFKILSEEKMRPIYLDESKLTKKISIPLRVNGKEVLYPVVSWGKCWYEADTQLEVLVEEMDRVKIVVDSLNTGEISEDIISLDGLPERNGYSVRLQMDIMFMDERTCKISLKDIGFGEFFKPSGFVKEHVIDLGGIHGQFNSMS
ncbi:MAG: DUF5716 family protein [Suipraeoptans sp.]